MSKSTEAKNVTETSFLPGFIELAAVLFLLLGLVFFWGSRRKEQPSLPSTPSATAPASASNQ